MSKYDKLFEPITFKSGVRAENRIVMAPMTHYSSNDDGTISDAELRYYAERAKGPGMVVTACANVTENGKAFTGQPGVHTDEMVESMKNWHKRFSKTAQKRLCKSTMAAANARLNSCPAGML